MTRRRIVISTVVVLAIVAAFSVASTRTRHDETVSAAPTPVKVRLKWLHQAQFAGFYVAKEKGFYQAEGLDVTLNAGGVDFPAVQMVAGGGEDFGVTGADQVLLARDKGVPVTALAVIYRESPFVLFALANSGITKPQDFVGRKVGIKLGGNEELTYRAVMRNAGVDSARVKEIPVKYDISPLLTGQVDVWPGYAINEPLVAEEQGYKVNLIWPSQYGVNLYADALFATDATVRERPDMVAKFVRATLRGWDYAIQRPEEAAQLTLRYSDRLNYAHELKMMQASIPLLKPDNNPIGWSDSAGWQGLATLLLDQGLLKQRLDVSSAFTTRFLVVPARK